MQTLRQKVSRSVSLGGSSIDKTSERFKRETPILYLRLYRGVSSRPKGSHNLELKLKHILCRRVE